MRARVLPVKRSAIAAVRVNDGSRSLRAEYTHARDSGAA